MYVMTHIDDIVIVVDFRDVLSEIICTVSTNLKTNCFCVVYTAFASLYLNEQHVNLSTPVRSCDHV